MRKNDSTIAGEHKFSDRTAAGQLLVELIHWGESDNLAVVAIPNGGLPVAQPIAEHLGIALTLCMTRRVTLTNDSELSVGSITAEGCLSLDRELLDFLGASNDAIEEGIARSRSELADLAKIAECEAADSSLAGKDVLLVDDVVATGNSVFGALNLLDTLGPRSVRLAAPVVSEYGARRLVDANVRVATMLIGRGQGFKPMNYYDDFSPIEVWPLRRDGTRQKQ